MARRSFFLFAASVLAVSAFELHVLQPQYGCDWSLDGDVDSKQTVSFTIALEEANLDKIRSVALGVSDPSSSNYGNYLTTHEVATLTAPSPHNVQIVTSWLDTHRVDYLRHLHQIEVTTTVKNAEALLNTRFHAVTHKSTSHSLVHARQ
jgi:tripeptidyl-peptidase-1